MRSHYRGLSFVILMTDCYCNIDKQNRRHYCQACVDAIVDGALTQSASSYRRKLRFVREKLSFLQCFHPSPLSPEFEGDVCLVGSDDVPIFAHRFVLTSKSEVFRKMFSADRQEDKRGMVRSASFDSHLLRAFVHYLYTVDITFTDKVTAKEMGRLAHKYQVCQLMTECDEVMASEFEENDYETELEDMVAKMKFSHAYGFERLKRTIIDLIKNNFDQLYKPILKVLLDSEYPNVG